MAFISRLLNKLQVAIQFSKWISNLHNIRKMKILNQSNSLRKQNHISQKIFWLKNKLFMIMLTKNILMQLKEPKKAQIPNR